MGGSAPRVVSGTALLSCIINNIVENVGCEIKLFPDYTSLLQFSIMRLKLQKN